jgi:hypothetical protein
MALKFGRTAGITSRIDPVTGTTMYTEDEYDAYQTAVGAEASRKKDYDASMAKFKTDSDTYYGKNTADTKGAQAAADLLNKSNAKGSKGEKIVATAATGMSQAESDKQLNDRIKRGELVSFNDPSVSEKTRGFLRGAAGSFSGRLSGDINKTYVEKGIEINEWKDMYGKNYDPVQWRKDVKAGKIDKYEAGMMNSPLSGYGTYTPGTAPVKPGEYVPTKIQKIDPKNVDWKERKLDPLKPTKVDQKKGKLRMPKEEEELTWQEPNFVKAKGVRVPQTRIKQSGKSGIEGAGKNKIVGGTKGSRIRYNTEGRQAMAYFSGNTSIGDKITGKTESELRDLKKETRGEGVRMLKEGRLGDALTIGKDLGTIRKATRYAKKGDISIGSKTGSVKEGQGSNLQYFTPERTKTNNEGAMSGYKEYKAQEKNKVEQARLEPAFRAMYDNAANRNTVGSQMEKLQGAASPTNSYSSLAITRGQMKDKYATDNPTASRSQVRKGVRDQIDLNRKLIQEVDKKIIK